MEVSEIVVLIQRRLKEEDYVEAVEYFVSLHPLKAALVVSCLYQRLHTTEKVRLCNELQASLGKHFVVEKHSVGVREFPNAATAKRWVDMNNGARLVEGEK